MTDDQDRRVEERAHGSLRRRGRERRTRLISRAKSESGREPSSNDRNTSAHVTPREACVALMRFGIGIWSQGVSPRAPGQLERVEPHHRRSKSEAIPEQVIRAQVRGGGAADDPHRDRVADAGGDLIRNVDRLQ